MLQLYIVVDLIVDASLICSFRNQFLFFLLHSLVMTLALVLAARKQDPRDYDEGIDIFRGICESFLLIFTLYNFVTEVYQLKK